MPGFTTHYIFGMKSYNDLPTNQLKFIIAKYRWLYQLGVQGPDMFFYNIPVLRHRDYRNVGSYMHEHHVQDFFSCCLKHLSSIASRQQREQGIAYLAGFFCHYIGDYICHPFVLLLIHYKKKKPSQFNQAATICLNGLETQFISRFLAECINETYYPLSHRNNYQVSARMVHRSILAMRFGCRTLADPRGKKKTWVSRVESVFLENPIASQKLVTDEVENPRESLNLEHRIWTNPWNTSLASSASFPELFRQCLGKCNMVYYYLNALITKEGLLEEGFPALLEELGNYSYHSGLPVIDEF